MLRDDMEQWMDKISLEAFGSKVFLRELFTNHYPNCDCRVSGKLAIHGKVNQCLTCYRHVSSIDAHLFYENFDLALICWLALIWKGNF